MAQGLSATRLNPIQHSKSCKQVDPGRLEDVRRERVAGKCRAFHDRYPDALSREKRG
jgi:hypothetical protein